MSEYHLTTEMIKIVEHGLTGNVMAVRAYAELLSQKCDKNSQKRINNVLNGVKCERLVCLDGVENA